MKHRLIAINLPQFHPFKENDEWWGKGFTEWTNVTKAKPRFRGHYQPHLPTETGFYDLRLPESREMQANMAKEAGIYGFCYYHYWFNGHQLMELPLEKILESGKPDFPFMLCWANENWSRNWDGGFTKMLIEQKYSAKDDIDHMRFLCEHYFQDSRYIRVNNKPMFVVYKPFLIPNIENCVKRWREVAAEYGMELYLGYMTRSDEDYISKGFDCAIDFQPHSRPSLYDSKWKQLLHFRSSNFLFRVCYRFMPRERIPFNMNFHYSDYSRVMALQTTSLDMKYPSVTPMWDNSSRRKGWFFMLKNSTPDLYKEWLRKTFMKFKPYSVDENFIFINAWNEWVEGNHLEPDIKWGRAYLDATKEVVDEFEGE